MIYWCLSSRFLLEYNLCLLKHKRHYFSVFYSFQFALFFYFFFVGPRSVSCVQCWLCRWIVHFCLSFFFYLSKANTIGVTYEAGTVYHEVTSGFFQGSCCSVFCVVFCQQLFVQTFMKYCLCWHYTLFNQCSVLRGNRPKSDLVSVLRCTRQTKIHIKSVFHLKYFLKKENVKNHVLVVDKIFSML